MNIGTIKVFAMDPADAFRDPIDLGSDVSSTDAAIRGSPSAAGAPSSPSAPGAPSAPSAPSAPGGPGASPKTGTSNSDPNVFDLRQLAPQNGDTNQILDNVLNYSAGIALVVAVFFIIYGGYQIMMAGEEPKKFESGVKTIKYTIIGILVIFLAKAIVNFVAERILQTGTVIH